MTVTCNRSVALSCACVTRLNFKHWGCNGDAGTWYDIIDFPKSKLHSRSSSGREWLNFVGVWPKLYLTLNSSNIWSQHWYKYQYSDALIPDMAAWVLRIGRYPNACMLSHHTLPTRADAGTVFVICLASGSHRFIASIKFIELISPSSLFFHYIVSQIKFIWV